MKAKLYLWHRRLALLVLVPLLLFGLSGLLHPVMRLTAPEMAQHFYPQPQWPANLPSIETLIKDSELNAVAGLRPVQVDQNWYIQSWENRSEPSQFLTLNAKPAQEIELAYAEQLARHYSGEETAGIEQIKLISEFSHQYPSINRLLPVWEVKFERDDNLSVFVDIRQDRLATITDDSRRLFMTLFHFLHVWAFIDQENPLRTALFISMMLISTFIGISGLYLFAVLPFKQRKNAQLKKIHAWTGVGISVALLMFVISGMVRTIEKLEPEIRGVPLNQSLALSDISFGLAKVKAQFPNSSNAQLHELDGRAVWQLQQPRQSSIWLDARSGEKLPEAAFDFAKQLVSNTQGQQPEEIDQRLVNSFKEDHSYGFIDKRLPVVAIDYDDKTYYVDTRDAVLSVKVDNVDKVYSWIFSYLHKWHFADGLGRDGRDGIISLFILAISSTSLLGFYTWLKARRKRYIKQKQRSRCAEVA
ncbi:PepSY domain-containing protein [Neptuniibacter sp. SY11_33]|uniref:PepSY domain-containing protein n=1 Tax=Neptuniibacter sp. SY11_33 TaxID=3398215 RepID=UPI0039F4C12F